MVTEAEVLVLESVEIVLRDITADTAFNSKRRRKTTPRFRRAMLKQRKNLTNVGRAQETKRKETQNLSHKPREALCLI
jgi:hypothetical protein